MFMIKKSAANACWFPIVLFCLVLFQTPFSATEKERQNLLDRLDPFERACFDDSKMPVEKAKMLIDSGIHLDEYFEYPWLKLGISEKDWIRQQSTGTVIGDTITSAKEIASQQWSVVQAFFVPGMHQFKRKQTFKGLLMSGIAVASVSLFILHRDPKDKSSIGFDYPAYLGILGADMLWSSIDIGIQINREQNKDAMRFSYRISLPIKKPFAVTNL